MNHDREYLALLVIEVEQVTRQDEVASGGDREKFGQPLDNAEDQRLEKQKPIHSQLSGPSMVDAG